MNPRPITPVKLTLLDGTERAFLLSMGGIRRLKDRLKAAKISDIMQQDLEAAGVPILYEALLDKNGISEEEFADLIPADLPRLTEAIVTLLDHSYPERKRKAEEDANPTPASPLLIH